MSSTSTSSSSSPTSTAINAAIQSITQLNTNPIHSLPDTTQLLTTLPEGILNIHIMNRNKMYFYSIDFIVECISLLFLLHLFVFVSLFFVVVITNVHNDSTSWMHSMVSQLSSYKSPGIEVMRVNQLDAEQLDKELNMMLSWQFQKIFKVNQ